MQLFRSQLSRFIPHPHRDSWMRNNLGNWLYLLRLTSFLTLVAAGCFTMFSAPASPLGSELDITRYLTNTLQSFKVTSAPQISQYIKWGLGSFLIISGLLCFRCGSRKKPKYMIPVIISILILLGSLIWLIATKNYNPYIAIPYIIPICCPIALLLYRQWENKLDHWNSFLAVILLATAAGYAFGMYLAVETVLDPSLVAFFDNLGINAKLTVKIMKSASALALAAALLLFIPVGRRLGLIALIYIATTYLIVRFVSHLSDDLPWYGFDYWSVDLLFHISHIMFPALILLSLSSRKKTQTLKL